MNYSEQIAALEKEREEVFITLQGNKNNPYWYEDYGRTLDEIDDKIAYLREQQLSSLDQQQIEYREGLQDPESEASKADQEAREVFARPFQL